MQRFYLGLNMSGTVSAGAYTAGVVDFLVEAMDAWYAERANQKQKFGTDYERWTIPPHELELDVLTGASGGGITAALAAFALNQEFPHMTKQRAADNPAVNLLFESWVEKIDITGLLGHRDLEGSGAKLVSLLDSSPIANIAGQAFQHAHPLPARREWVRDGLKVVLTLTNLRGVPYAVEPDTDVDSARTLYHADRQDYAVWWGTPRVAETGLRLNPDGSGAWPQLSQTAMATSAFPVVLAARTLDRTAGEYNARKWRIANDEPQCEGQKICDCEDVLQMPPAWALADGFAFKTLNVDGGATNNSPVDCARLELAELDPKRPGGHNVREPLDADRAVISVAPLATELAAGLPAAVSPSLLELPLAFVNVLVNQSRIQGENLQLGSNPDVASRWVIAPTTEISGTEPLAGSLLSAFGAFVAQVYREHDYQLGRRNCQRFLMNYFGLPWGNRPIFKQYGLSDAARARLNAEYGFMSEGSKPEALCPLIPVMPALRTPVVVTREAISRDQLGPIADQALDRLKRVANAWLAESGGGFTAKLGLDAVWLFVKGKLREKLVMGAAKELSPQGFVD